MRRLQEEMNRTFANFFSYDPFRSSGFLLSGPENMDLMKRDYRSPLADVWETDKEIVAKIELPGVDKKDIKVRTRDNGLEISVENKNQYEYRDEKKNIYRAERSYSGFYRYFELPDYADKDKINATYKNGILELRIAKKYSKDKGAKNIEVK